MRLLPGFVAVALAVLLSACASAPEKVSSSGRYGDTPALQTRGITQVRPFEGTFDEVWDSARQVIPRMGMFIEESDKGKGKLAGSGIFQTVCNAGPCGITMVYAVYLKEIKGQEPRVETTVMADAPKMYNWQGEGHSRNLVYRIIGDIQKNLATLR